MKVPVDTKRELTIGAVEIWSKWRPIKLWCPLGSNDNTQFILIIKKLSRVESHGLQPTFHLVTKWIECLNLGQSELIVNRSIRTSLYSSLNGKVDFFSNLVTRMADYFRSPIYLFNLKLSSKWVTKHPKTPSLYEIPNLINCPYLISMRLPQLPYCKFLEKIDLFTINCKHTYARARALTN